MRCVVSAEFLSAWCTGNAPDDDVYGGAGAYQVRSSACERVVAVVAVWQAGAVDFDIS